MLECTEVKYKQVPALTLEKKQDFPQALHEQIHLLAIIHQIDSYKGRAELESLQDLEQHKARFLFSCNLFELHLLTYSNLGQGQAGGVDAFGQLVKHLLSEYLQSLANINLTLNNLGQQRNQFLERSVFSVVVPALDQDPVLRLQLEVLGHVVNNDRPVKLPAQTAQVLEEEAPGRDRVLSVEPVLDYPLRVQVVQDPVGVVLDRRGEDHNLEAGLHLVEKVLKVRPGQVLPVAVVFDVVHHRLVQVQHQGVPVLLELRQERGLAGADLLDLQDLRVPRVAEDLLDVFPHLCRVHLLVPEHLDDHCFQRVDDRVLSFEDKVPADPFEEHRDRFVVMGQKLLLV